jgi:4-alpha-glucanotransferase
MITNRSSGILAHMTSLPSPFGIGDLGPSSYRFIDFLRNGEQSYWQFLPIGPTDEHLDYSPYMSSSAFAGSFLLLSPEHILEKGLINRRTLEHPNFSPYFVEFKKVEAYKSAVLKEAFQNFRPDAEPGFQDFLNAQSWLDDYASFMTLKRIHNGAGWFDWPTAYAAHDLDAVTEVCNKNREVFDYYRFEQYLFFEQWQSLHRYAMEKQVQLFGDLPIYVSLDSVDVWANQELFLLDRKTFRPTYIAGVPPDYFSKTGQRWGNPLYDWQNKDSQLKSKLYAWWEKRFAHLFTMIDMVRIDHFRGFAAYWSILAEEETAINGEWLPGPGRELFDSISAKLGMLSIVAEDLGTITEDVEKLRDDLGYPGMKILQFAFDENQHNPYLPWNFTSANCVVYTGTHDNDTTVGWFLSDQLDDGLRQKILQAANRSLHDQGAIHENLIYLAQASTSNLCIFPMQDLLGFGSDCRMNKPGTSSGNWRWRCAPQYISKDLADQVRNMTLRFGRGRQKNSHTGASSVNT